MQQEHDSRSLIEDLRRDEQDTQLANMKLHEALKSEVALLRQSVETMKLDMKKASDDLKTALLLCVQKMEFAPVKIIAYGLAGSALTALFGAIMKGVFK